MPPAPRNVVSQDIVNPDSGRTGGAPEDPLVPLLPVEGDALDPVALAMWHLGLASGTAVEVPHDLFALWLFAVAGGVVGSPALSPSLPGRPGGRGGALGGPRPPPPPPARWGPSRALTPPAPG